MKMNLRGMGIAALVAGALCATSSNVRATSLEDLINLDETLDVGDLEFSHFSASFSKVSDGLNSQYTDLSQILVVTADPHLDTGIQFKYGLSLSAGQNVDLDIQYRVKSLDGAPIYANHIDISEYAPAHSSTNASFVNVSEGVYTWTPGNLLTNEDTMLAVGSPDTGANIFAIVPPGNDYYIIKDMDFVVAAGDNVAGTGATIAGSEIIQTWVVPEPTSAALIVLLGGGLMGMRRLRRWRNS